MHPNGELPPCLAASKPLPGKDRQCRHLSAQATTASVMVLLLVLVLGLPPRR